MTKVSLMSLDVGRRRIGIALARGDVRIPHPLTTLDYSEQVAAEIVALAQEYGIQQLIIGLPRNLEGDDTPQTAFVRDFAQRLTREYALTTIFQDEALTSVKAEQELKIRAKPYVKADIDALAATYILEDYLHDHEVARSTHAEA